MHADPTTPANEPDPATPIRRLLLAVILVATIGLLLELLFLEHTESFEQWIPFLVLVAGLAAGVATLLRPGRRIVRLFQAIMLLSVGTGLLGLYLHYRGNIAFELELDPSAQGLDLVWRSLRGATPALAPGAMVQLGLLGLVYTFRHPALHRRGNTFPTPHDTPKEIT